MAIGVDIILSIIILLGVPLLSIIDSIAAFILSPVAIIGSTMIRFLFSINGAFNNDKNLCESVVEITS